MAKVGVIIVNYRADPEPLVNSVLSSKHDVRWYMFLHGQDPSLKAKVDTLAERINSRYFPYGINRGVARSWNEGLQASFDDGNDITIILNDDMFFYGGGFDQFVGFVLEKIKSGQNFGAITVYGLETGTSDGIGSSTFYLKPNWQGGACMAIGRKAVETIGYFDQNFWPAYYEDADYFRRLELSGLPILWDGRTLLEHNRSYSLRADPLLKRLHNERFWRNKRYYLTKWGGLRQWGGPEAEGGTETLTHPFADETIDYVIPRERIEAPYGPQYDRSDLGSSASLGLLEDEFSEELLSILMRHAIGSRRLLEWGAGENTPIMAGFAALQNADLLLSIDHRADMLRRIATDTPKYAFLHFRNVDPEEVLESDGDGDIAYALYPAQLGLDFDVILISGRWRMECAVVAQRILAPDGIVILKDWQKPRYSAVRQLFNVVQEGSHYLALCVGPQKAKRRKVCKVEG